MVRKLLLLVFVLVVANAFFSGSGERSRAPASAQANGASVAAPARTPAPVQQAPRGWRYSEHEDAMTGKGYKLARIRSDNSLSLDFPYRGTNHGTLSVRQHPRYGLDVYVSVDKGQILCRGEDYWRCIFTIRFDDGKPERFTANRAEDGSSTVVFSAYPKWAVEKLRGAKKVTVQLLMYQSGNQTLTFTVDEPLVW